jgi:hypothetical protein
MRIPKSSSVRLSLADAFSALPRLAALRCDLPLITKLSLSILIPFSLPMSNGVSAAPRFNVAAPNAFSIVREPLRLSPDGTDEPCEHSLISMIQNNRSFIGGAI